MPWPIQPPPCAFDARVNDSNPAVLTGAQLTVTDAHGGVGVDGAFNAGVVGWPERAELALGADEQAVASSRATSRVATTRRDLRAVERRTQWPVRMCKAYVACGFGLHRPSGGLGAPSDGGSCIRRKSEKAAPKALPFRNCEHIHAKSANTP